jgi:small ligand-binding sensory domain FIST
MATEDQLTDLKKRADRIRVLVRNLNLEMKTAVQHGLTLGVGVEEERLGPGQVGARIVIHMEVRM